MRVCVFLESGSRIFQSQPQAKNARLAFYGSGCWVHGISSTTVPEVALPTSCVCYFLFPPPGHLGETPGSHIIPWNKINIKSDSVSISVKQNNRKSEDAVCVSGRLEQVSFHHDQQDNGHGANGKRKVGSRMDEPQLSDKRECHDLGYHFHF